MTVDAIPNKKDSLGKARHAMPQITDFQAFIDDLDNEGIPVVTISINPKELTPTQGQFNEEKVDYLKKSGKWKDKPIISSDDDYILDGHHRWLAAHSLGEKIESRVIGLPIDELLDFVKDKPYVTKKKLHEGKKMNESMSNTLETVNKYYNRVAKREGGTVYADILNDFTKLRELLQANPEKTLKNKASILLYISKITDLINR